MGATLPPSPSLSGTSPLATKRKRSPSVHEPRHVKRYRKPLFSSSSTAAAPLSHPQQQQQHHHNHRHHHDHPPTASPAAVELQHQQQSTDKASFGIEQQQRQRPRPQSLAVTPSEHQRRRVPKGLHDSPIAHWAETSCWPSDIARRGFGMPDSSSASGSKRRRSSTSASERHRADQIRTLELHGVFTTKKSFLGESGREDCNALLQPRNESLSYPPFPPEKIDDVLDRITPLNEARFVKDMMPWLTPSAETLRFCGEPIYDYIGEEVNARWSRCTSIAGRSQPDYVVGLLPTAFTHEERLKLENMHTPDRPFYFTPELSYPFLVCEAKDSQQGIEVPQLQNLHYTTVAIRAIINLYAEAFGADSLETQSLSGQALAFSVSLTSSQVVMSCHYAISRRNFTTGNPELAWNFFRKEILFCHPGVGSEERNKSYAFVRNVYDKFASKHMVRIQHAVAALPTITDRAGVSCEASDLSVEESAQQQGDGNFKKPAMSASSLLNEQISRVEAMNERLLSELEEARVKAGEERVKAEQERVKAEQERQEAKVERQRAEAEKQRLIEEQQQERQRMQAMMEELIRKRP